MKTYHGLRIKLLTKQFLVADTIRTFQEMGDADGTDDNTDVMFKTNTRLPELSKYDSNFSKGIDAST